MTSKRFHRSLLSYVIAFLMMFNAVMPTSVVFAAPTPGPVPGPSISAPNDITVKTTDIGAKVYKDSDYHTNEVDLGEGSYTLAQLQAKGMLNDDISSIKVEKGFIAYLYEHDNFGGRVLEKTSDDENFAGEEWDPFNGDMNDKVSSIKIGLDIGTATKYNAPSRDGYTIDNNAPDPSVFPVGTTTINWVLKNRQGNVVGSDTQTIIVTVPDIVPPTLSINAGNPAVSITNAKSTTYYFNFSEDVKNFDASDITVTDNGVAGTKGTFTTVDASHYTLVVPFIGTTTQVVSVAAGKCTDLAENNNIAQSNTLIIDQTAPAGSVVGNPTDWTNADANLIVTGSDVGSQIASVVGPAGATNIADTSSFTATKNGTYNFVITDLAGNVTTYPVTVTFIDKDAPSIQLNGDASVTVEAGESYTDAGYNVSDPPYNSPVVTTSWDKTLDTKVEGTYTITYTATDHALNTASVSRTVIVKDTIAPTTPKIDFITPSSYASGTWSTSNVTYAISGGTDNGTGIANYQYSYDNGTTWNKYEGQLTLSDGTYNISARAVDGAGHNSPAATAVVNVDTTKPTAGITGNPTAWINTSATLTINATDVNGSGVKRIQLPDGSYVEGATANYTAPKNGSYTFIVEDNAGNAQSFVVNVTMIDTSKPVITLNADLNGETTVTVEAGTAYSDVLGATVTDDQDKDIQNRLVIDSSKVDTSKVGTYQVTYNVTDQAGNVADTVVRTVVVKDTTAPVFTSTPADISMEATAVLTPIAKIGTAVATDLFHVDITNDALAGGYPVGVTKVTWTATDPSGNHSTYVQNITITDNTKPVLTVPADITFEATAVKSLIDIGMATATDNATDPSQITIICDAPADRTFPLGTTTVTWTATDANKNTITGVQKVKVVDTTAPVLTIPLDITKEATAIDTPVDIGVGTATDIFGAKVTNNAPAAFQYGATIATWKAVDPNGNSVTGTQRITIVDTTAPVITVPADITTEATAVRTKVNIGKATATDIYGVTINSDAPVDYSLGTTSVTWTATDIHGNVSTKVQKVTIVDTTKPVLTVPADITQEATAVLTPVSIGFATASDIFGVTVTNNAPTAFPVGTTEVTWTATDANGNISTGIQKITIKDTTKPDLKVPFGIIKEATAIKTPVNIGKATATDIFHVDITNNAPTDGFDYGRTKVTWTATDANGNISTQDQWIIITDHTKPVLTVPANITVEATGPYTKVDIGTATATDIFRINALYPWAPVYDWRFPVGTTDVTWTATDEHGNSTPLIQKVTVKDTTPPVLKVPADIAYEAGSIGATVYQDIYYQGYAVPLSIGKYTLSQLKAKGMKDNDISSVKVTAGYKVYLYEKDNFSGNVLIRTSDDNNFLNDKMLHDTFNDKISSIIVTCNIGEAIATDTVTAQEKIDITNDAPDVFPYGDTIVTWTAKDESGNPATGTQKVSIIDTIKPVITVPADITTEATAVRTPVSIGTATATDLFAVTITSDAPADYPVGTTTVTWKATDEHGNFSTGTQNVTVTDKTAPVLVVPKDITIEATGKLTPVDIGTATATDLFAVKITNDAPKANEDKDDAVSTTYSFPVGVTTVTWTAIDANNNKTQGTQKVTVTDTKAPDLTVTGIQDEMIVYNDPAVFTATATDKADPDVKINVDVNGTKLVPVDGKYSTSFDKLKNTITVTATDNSGNSTTQTFTIRRIIGGGAVSSSPAIAAYQAQSNVSLVDEKTGKLYPILSNIAADKDGVVNLTPAQKNDLMSKVDSAISTNKLSADDGLKLVFEISSDTNMTNSVVNLPTEVINWLSGDKIVTTAIKNPVAELDFVTTSLKADADTISIKSSIVSTDSLSKDLQDKIGDSDVFNFSVNAISGQNSKVINTPNVKVLLPYEIVNENNDKIRVYEIKADDSLAEMQNSYDADNSIASFTTDKLGKYFVVERVPAFSDLGSCEWAEDAINALTEKGIINGRTEKLFEPSSYVTRAEFTSWIVNLLNLDGKNVELKFTDVDKTNKYYNSIAAAYKAGLIEGISDTTFAPNENITRQDIAVIMIRALKTIKKVNINENAKLTFIDANLVSDYAVPSIALAVKEGLIDGYPDKSFKPLNNTNRAEAATLVYKLFLIK